MTYDRSSLQPPFPGSLDALNPEQAARVEALTAAERVLPDADTHDLILVAGFILTGAVPWETIAEEPRKTAIPPFPSGEPYRVTWSGEVIDGPVC